MVRAGSACAVCKPKACLYPMRAKHAMDTAAFLPLLVETVGPCRYVGVSIIYHSV